MLEEPKALWISSVVNNTNTSMDDKRLQQAQCLRNETRIRRFPEERTNPSADHRGTGA
ncbi:hypothetical protein OESDEN_24595 [Oesophagostomum dentatum]|uniref:Uncharacterized protein n=1 Tax=Oesophagostomum dentatum TaxID=61180 RepID=A0A0B1RSY7_OESDE|nr:hypothetical protein OESDEN_24595 [Oesophagostomum dentatum]